MLIELDIVNDLVVSIADVRVLLDALSYTVTHISPETEEGIALWEKRYALLQRLRNMPELQDPREMYRK